MRLHIRWGAIFFVLLAIAIPASSATIVSPESKTFSIGEMYKKITSMKVKDFQKLIGRKLTIKEKIGFLILKHKIKQQSKNYQKQGEIAFVFGIAALSSFIIGLFVPFVLLGSLVSAIVAVVTGSVAKKQDPSDRKAHAGKLLGWITLGLIALLLILIAIVLAAWI